MGRADENRYKHFRGHRRRAEEWLKEVKKREPRFSHTELSVDEGIVIDKGRMNRETHVRFCESLRVKVPLATRLRGQGLLGPSYSINQIIGRNKFDSFKVKTPFIHTKGRKINFLRASKISFTESLTQLYDQNLILIHSV